MIDQEKGKAPVIALSLILIVVVSIQIKSIFTGGEPFFNNDETRHLMTGVFMRDVLHDLPLMHLRDYVVRYYLQYPALGLLVWPPLFYLAEGMVMSLFGTSFPVGRLLILAFSCLAVYYLFQLSRRTHGLLIGVLACLFMAVSPLYFLFSQRIMLEMPTLAFSLGTLYFFYRYLEGDGKKYSFFAAISCCLAMITRFDALFLFPTLLTMALVRGQGTLIFRKEVFQSLVLCVALASPIYAATILEFGKSHVHAISNGTSVDSSHFLAVANFIFYPSAIPEQMGWLIPILSVLGIFFIVLRRDWRLSAPFIALAAGTYLTFTPMAELEARHAIYWIPALSFFAAYAIATFSKKWARTAFVAGGVFLGGTAYATLKVEPGYMFGYEEAARYVLDNTKASSFCLFDNYLNGDFIYQIRRHDPGRRIGVLRGDKLFYGVLSDPHGAYKELAKGKEDILAGIYKYDPEYIVVEDPQVEFDLPMAALLRQVLKNTPERFTLVKAIPLRTNKKWYQGVSLLIYRNALRNPKPSPLNELQMVGMEKALALDKPDSLGTRSPPSELPTSINGK